jgi:hypothetical protein
VWAKRKNQKGKKDTESKNPHEKSDRTTRQRVDELYATAEAASVPDTGMDCKVLVLLNEPISTKAPQFKSDNQTIAMTFTKIKKALRSPGPSDTRLPPQLQ